MRDNCVIRTNGYAIHTRMTQSTPLNVEAIRRHMGDVAARVELSLLQQCASTNASLLEQGTTRDTLSVLVCEEQTAGRGRRGRNWISSGTRSLTFSLGWRCMLEPAKVSGLSLVAGLAVAEALADLGMTGVRLKWPNDVLFRGGKLAGILVDMQSNADAGLDVIIGIGLNVELPDLSGLETPETDQDSLAPAALSQGLAQPDRNLVLAAILSKLIHLLDEFAREGFAPFSDRWAARHAWAGHFVQVRMDGMAPIHGNCLAVDSDGALLVDTGRGVQRVLGGDVSLREVN